MPSVEQIQSTITDETLTNAEAFDKLFDQLKNKNKKIPAHAEIKEVHEGGSSETKRPSQMS